jgi:ABC-type branched-subunit amino acid transport system ATPase component
MTSETLLSVSNVDVRYGAAQALFGVSVEIPAGEAMAVLGANGAGKSTLARALSGLVTPTAGRITFAGEDITGWHPHRIRRAGLLYLPEGRGVFPALTVTENLRIAAVVLPRAQRRAAVERGLEIFPPLRARRRQPAALLSGGEQQMLSLARALILSPRLVIADEMSLGLAPKMVDLVFESLGRARAAGTTIVLIEQFVHRALGFADRCTVLHRGSVRWTGDAAEAKGEMLRHYLGEATTGGAGDDAAAAVGAA